jgi:pyridoxal/pyridoxine/pyridoxamine kinase
VGKKRPYWKPNPGSKYLPTKGAINSIVGWAKRDHRGNPTLVVNICPPVVAHHKNKFVIVLQRAVKLINRRKREKKWQ